MKVSRFIAQLLLASLPLTIAGGAFAQQTAEPVASTANKTSSAAKSNNTEVAETVVIESTITGNQEQPKTIYVLPWQDSVARIKMPAAERPKTDSATKPLDREQFLRFIQAQPLLAPKENVPGANAGQAQSAVAVEDQGANNQ